MLTETLQELAAQLEMAMEMDAAIGMHVLEFAHHQQLAELADFAAASGALPASLQTAVDKRRREFIAGRYCAAKALTAAGFVGGVDGGAIAPLAIGADRVPLWPPGWCGSISHSAAAAIAVAAPVHAWRALGVDLEVLLDEGSASNIETRVGSQAEWALLARFERCLRVSLLFCAKEALYKALYPLLRRFQDFTAARLVACDATTLVLQLSCAWGPDWPAGVTVKVRYAQLAQQVCTLVQIR